MFTELLLNSLSQIKNIMRSHIAQGDAPISLVLQFEVFGPVHSGFLLHEIGVVVLVGPLLCSLSFGLFFITLVIFLLRDRGRPRYLRFLPLVLLPLLLQFENIGHVESPQFAPDNLIFPLNDTPRFYLRQTHNILYRQIPLLRPLVSRIGEGQTSVEFMRTQFRRICFLDEVDGLRLGEQFLIYEDPREVSVLRGQRKTVSVGVELNPQLRDLANRVLKLHLLIFISNHTGDQGSEGDKSGQGSEGIK